MFRAAGSGSHLHADATVDLGRYNALANDRTAGFADILFDALCIGGKIIRPIERRGKDERNKRFMRHWPKSEVDRTRDQD